MNPLVLQFANGNVYFIGLAIVIAASILSLRASGIILRSAITILAIIGLLLVALSATPQPSAAYSIWFLIWSFDFIVSRLPSRAHYSPSRRRYIAARTVILSLILIGIEIPSHLAPTITISANQPVFVIGDSLTAGISAKERPWPEVLAQQTHLHITNLAQPGATAETALKQASQIHQTNAVIFVEIGGNDLLSDERPSEFRDHLDQLLARINLAGNQIVLFEIPLIPFHNKFGEAQRNLAKQYHAALLPKRFLTTAFGTPDGTLDGLHLSQNGHDALAAEIQVTLKIN